MGANGQATPIFFDGWRGPERRPALDDPYWRIARQLVQREW
jgi:hypothetical protein